MKISPLTIIVLIGACAASGFAGYYAGQSKTDSAVAAAVASAKHAAGGIKIVAGANSAAENVTLDSLLKGPGVPDADLLASWARNLNPKDCAALMAQLQSMKGGAVRDSVLAAVINAWAKKDPQGLLVSVDKLNSPHMREGGVDTALKAWAAQDPTAALQWLKDNPGGASTRANQARYDAAIAGYAQSDPQGAFNAVNALADGNARDQQNKADAFKALSDSMAQQGRFTDAIQMFSALPAGETRSEAMDSIAQNWATSSPEDASAWALTITDPADRTHLEGQVAVAWAASDPAAAAQWAMQLDQQASANADPNAPATNDPLNGPGMILANAIVAWAQDDLDGPGNFLNSMPASPDKDRAVAIFAMHASEEDPEGAVKWISTVTDPKIQQGVTMVVALQMYQQDPNMFTNFVTTSDVIPDAQKQSLQQIMPILGPSMAVLKSMTGKGGDPMSNMMESVLTGQSNPLTALVRARGGAGGGGLFGNRGAATPPAQPAQ